MGSTAYTTFYKYFLKRKIERTLSSEITWIGEKKDYDKYNNIPVIPIQHSSGANPRFSKMLKNKDIIKIIKKIIIS